MFIAHAVIPRRVFLRGLAAAGAAWVLRPWCGLAQSVLRICARCGHEAGPGDEVCGHCGAPLPRVEPAPEPPPPPEPEPEPAHQTAASARRAALALERTHEMLTTRGAWAGALLAARHATALHAAAGSEPAARTRLHAAMADHRARLTATEIECPVCEGAGHQRTRVLGIAGDIIEQPVPGLACAVCRGRGQLPAHALPADLARAMADAGAAFADLQRRAGMSEALGIWLPQGLDEDLDVRTRAALRRTFDVDCPTCQAFARLGCARCQGAGAIRCTNRNCVHGTELCPDCGGRGREARGRRCDTCRGAGRRPCGVCDGSGGLPCAACDRAGRLACATCNGTGRPASCTRCEGTGLTACTRCRGSGRGRDDEPCAWCGGEGAALCATCQGFGRGRRR